MVNLVLDLDETLIHTAQITTYFSKKLAAVTDFHFQINRQYYWVQKRPGLELFLNFVFRHFQVGIWTAAEKEYAKEICRNILTIEQLHKTKFIYSRNFCHLDTERMPPMFTKPLDKIYQLFPEYNPMNTIMIDNSVNVMRFNPQNGINVPDFTGDHDDYILYKLRNLIIQYYQKIPMNLPVLGLVSRVNQALMKDGGGKVAAKRTRRKK